MDLFDGLDEPNNNLSSQHIKLPGADLDYYPSFIEPKLADSYLGRLLDELDWRQETIRMYGKDILTPRLSAWYGDPDVTYSYSGIDSVAPCWMPTLEEIKLRIEQTAAIKINSVLANLYRDGQDSVSWHADDESSLGGQPVIASVSLGETRAFQMKSKVDSQQRFQLELSHGSLLIMSGDMQRNWLHQVPKTQKRVGQRINLTYRYVYPKVSI